MGNNNCKLCHQRCDKPVLLQCKHPICYKCAQKQFSSELLRMPCDHFPSNTEHKQKEEKHQIHDEKKTINICCPICNEKTILMISQVDIKLSNNQQFSIVNDGLGENQQQQYIPDEMLQWVFQFLNAKELFKKIRFTCKRMDKIVRTSLLHIRCQRLQMNGLKFAGKILPMETQLQELNLMATNIGDNVATEIAKAFPLLQQLQILDLSWNQIRNLGATAIANSIRNLTQLQVLNISFNTIEHSGITAISNATKELTNLQQLHLSDENLKAVYRSLMNIFNKKGIELYLNVCCIDDACAISIAKMLPHLTQLQRLDLGGNQIGDTGATALANAIKNLTKLQKLYFNDNQIGDTGATAIGNCISNLAQLQVLHFHNNQIGDTGATAIGNCASNLTQLQVLHFHNNQIRDINAIEIDNSISNLAQLGCLTLFFNNISKPVKQQLQEQFGYKLII